MARVAMEKMWTYSAVDRGRLNSWQDSGPDDGERVKFFCGSAVSCLTIRTEVYLQAAEATTAKAFSKEDVDARGRSVRALALQEA